MSLVRPSFAAWLAVLVLALGLPAFSANGFADGTSSTTATLGHVKLVPGLAGLATNGSSPVTGISCATPGNCAAFGWFETIPVAPAFYTVIVPFVVNEVRGRWERAKAVGGIASQPNGFKDAQLSSIDCPTPGNCSAAGAWFLNLSGTSFAQDFVVNEVNGTWGVASAVQGMTPYQDDGPSPTPVLSCWTAGNCALGGAGAIEADGARGWATVANEVDGSWQPGRILAGLPPASAQMESEVTSMSCVSGGYCVAGVDVDQKGYDVTGVDGTWQAIQPLPKLVATDLDGAPSPRIEQVSCSAKGSCTMIGKYTARGPRGEGFTASEVNGRWGDAIPIAGLAHLNTGAGGGLTLVGLSCPTAGECTDAGIYIDSSGRSRAFVADEVHGRWEDAMQVPGLQGMGPSAQASSLSCPSEGSCAVVGTVEAGSGIAQAFDAVELGGRWMKAELLPGVKVFSEEWGGDLSAGDAIACAGALVCVAGGNVGGGGGRAFLTSG